jgi:hypothetical protein
MPLSKSAPSNTEQYYMATQWQLMWRKLKRHRLALAGMVMLSGIYGSAILADFLAPYEIYKRHTAYIYCPPQRIHLIDAERQFHFRPFVYGWKTRRDPVTYERLYEEEVPSIPSDFYMRASRTNSGVSSLRVFICPVWMNRGSFLYSVPTIWAVMSSPVF